MRAAPAEILAALEAAEAGILCVQPQEGELPARMAIVGVVERRRIRYAHMVGVTPRIVREGLMADPQILADSADALRDKQYEPTLATHRIALETPFGSSWKGAAKPDVAKTIAGVKKVMYIE